MSAFSAQVRTAVAVGRGGRLSGPEIADCLWRVPEHSGEGAEEGSAGLKLLNGLLGGQTADWVAFDPWFVRLFDFARGTRMRGCTGLMFADQNTLAP